MHEILKKLEGGDRRYIGRSDEVVEEVLKDSNLFAEVFEGMLNNNPIIRMRAADVIEKVSVKHPEYLHPYKSKLINQVAEIEQQEVRWHVAQRSYIINAQSFRVLVYTINIMLNILKKDIIKNYTIVHSKLTLGGKMEPAKFSTKNLTSSSLITSSNFGVHHIQILGSIIFLT